jgi:hypothetical protein
MDGVGQLQLLERNVDLHHVRAAHAVKVDHSRLSPVRSCVTQDRMAGWGLKADLESARMKASWQRPIFGNVQGV